MKSLWRGWTLVMVMLALWLGAAGMAFAQVRTTAVSDTVYRADGTGAGGSVVISWGAFTTAHGEAVPAGSTTATLGPGGALSVALAPNAGATPMGCYYTAVYHLNDGTTSKEYWVVPVVLSGGAPVKVAAMRNTVLPTTVAMQTVSKQYVDTQIERAAFGALDTSLYVEKAGDTMTGPLELPGDPVSPLQAADKSYVDAQTTAVTTGLDGKVALLPSVTQNVVQPDGTKLAVDRLNGSLYASQMTGTGAGLGLEAAIASTDCGVGCTVVLDPAYVGDEANFRYVNSQQQVVDERGAGESRLSVDPTLHGQSAQSIMVYATRQDTDLAAATGGSPINTHGLDVTINAMAGGQNQFPQGVETTPYFKSTYSATQLVGNYFTQGQHVQASNVVNCYAIGDCLTGSQVIFASGGLHDPSDEGVHQADVVTSEAESAFSAICNSSCTTGSTSVMTTPTFGGQTQGDGRYLMDTNPAKVLTAGSLIGGQDTTLGLAEADFSGTSFGASTFLMFASDALSQPLDIAPGTLTVAIKTSGVPAGFATNTAALPASSGIACVVDPYPLDLGYEYFETAPYSVVDGSHIQFTLRKVHPVGAVIGVGGLCGYGLEQKVDSGRGLKQVFPVVGSFSGTKLYYAGSGSGLVGVQDKETTSGYANYSLTVASISRTNNVVSVTLAAAAQYDLNGLTLTVSGVADSSYNGAYPVTTTSGQTLTYPNAGPDSTTSGGTLQIVTGSYALYPMAEVVSVYNPATKAIDGLFTLAPNHVEWASGDTLEEPHYYVMNVYADTENVNQFIPRPYEKPNYGGKTFAGEMGPGMNGWRMRNQVPTTEYLGGGGTHHAPDSAFVSSGVWKTNFEADAGTESAMWIHCNLHGCNRWDSAYNLFRLDARDQRTDTLSFDPNTHTATWQLFGVNYSFSPSAFTAGTINVENLNATTITGGLSGSSITSGTIAAARLPVFGPSGTTHAQGAVPDPGPVAGATHFLREDGQWAIPPGGGGGSAPSGSAAGDLGGVYPSPTVVAVHAVSGTLDGVTIGGTTQAAASVTSLSTTGTVLVDRTTAANIPQTMMSYSTVAVPVVSTLLPASAGGDWVYAFGNQYNSSYAPHGLSVGGDAAGVYLPPVHGLAVGTTGQFQVSATGAVSKTAGVASGSAANNDLVGTLTLSAGSTTSASLTFAGTYASAPVCLVQPQNATPSTVSALAGWSAQVSATGLSVTVGTAPGAAVTFGYVCMGRN